VRQLDLMIRADRVVTSAGERAAAVGILDGHVVALEGPGWTANAAATIECARDEVLLPGLVDSHVHICEPGHTDWEGFASATRAAAAGGITTLVDMPIDSEPATVNIEALEEKRRSANGKCHVDVGFWGGITPRNANELVRLDAAGVLGFKCFLIDSGAPDLPAVSLPDLEAALVALRRIDALTVVHAELGKAGEAVSAYSGRRYRGYLASRPRRLENEAIDELIAAAERTGARIHIAHLSSSDALPAIRSAVEAGVRISAETCPHYLAIAAKDVPDGDTRFKAAPPIRDADNQELLWQGLEAGVLTMIVSDHSPCMPAMKTMDTGDFGAAWGGISSLQLSLPVVWTEARRRGYTLEDLARWMAAGPADLVGLPAKGRIAVGADADFSIFAPDDEFVVDETKLYHRNPMTPYVGRTLTGTVRRTFLGGQAVDPSLPRGRLLGREHQGSREAIR
jgi:allantoinase